ncbi:Major facilitator super domain-containing protein 7, variant 3 [Chamberlinius hualienensis]
MDSQSCKVSVISIPSSTAKAKTDIQPIRLYKERWLIVIVVSLFQILSGTIWSSFPSVANISASYFKVSFNAVNWLTQVFYLMYVIGTIPAMWLLKAYGIRIVIYAISASGALGASIRLFGTFEFVPSNYRFTVTIIGQTISGLTFPLLMVLPTQISQSWFPDNQRVIITLVTTLTAYLGSLIGTVTAPFLTREPSEMFIMNDSFCVPSILLSGLGFLVRNSEPPTPPCIVTHVVPKETLTTASIIKSFIIEIKSVLRNRNAILLAVAGGGIIGALPLIYLTLFQQLLCPAGYTNEFVAIYYGIIQAVGLVVSPALAHFLGRLKLFDETVKISAAFIILLSIALALLMRLENMTVVLMVLGAFLMILTFTATPICMELVVETSYPVNEGITGSIFWMSNQIQAAAILPIMTAFGQPLNLDKFKSQTCTVGDSVKAYDLICKIILLTILGATL